MKEVFNVLKSKEKRTLGLLCGLLAAALVVFIFISLKPRNDYVHLQGNLQAKQKGYERLSSSRDAEAEERARWKEAKKDIEEIKMGYFYIKTQGIQELRLDLEELFQKTGINYSQIHYEYITLPQKNVKKVNVSFSFPGTYYSFKKFLDSVERFPKFLFVEKIDFLDVSSQPGWLEVKIVLAGYYES